MSNFKRMAANQNAVETDKLNSLNAFQALNRFRNSNGRDSTGFLNLKNWVDKKRKSFPIQDFGFGRSIDPYLTLEEYEKFRKARNIS